MSIVETMMNLPVEHSRNIFGQFDAYAKLIEKNLGVTLIVRDDKLKILGTAEAAEQA